MTTKDNCLFFEEKYHHVFNDKLNNHFDNLNLNQNNEWFSANNQSTNIQNHNKEISNYVKKLKKTCAIFFDEFFKRTAVMTASLDNSHNNDPQRKQNFTLCEKSKLTSTLTNPNIHNDYSKKEEKYKNANKSTLSLHISAYENSIKASTSDDPKDCEKNGRNKKKENNSSIKSLKAVRKLVKGSATVNYALELPRQQKVQNNDPEVMQFKASQQLSNVNGELLSSIAEHANILDQNIVADDDLQLPEPPLQQLAQPQILPGNEKVEIRPVIKQKTKKFMKPCRQLSIETILSLFVSIIGVFVASFITPIVLRWILLPNIVSHSQNLDFTFRTCTDQLYGVCSFPEAILDLDEKDTVLSPGYYYSFSLNIELVDSPENRKLGMFQAQLSPKDITGASLANYKKTVLLRPSFYSKVYTFIRNTVFFPLYIVGFFPSFDTSKSILFTDNFFESSDNPTKSLFIELQNRFIQVASADFHIRAHVGFSSYLLYNWPATTFLILFSVSLAIYSGLCILYWGNRGIDLWVVEEEETVMDASKNDIVLKDNQRRSLNPLPYIKVLISSLFPAFLKPAKKKRA